VGDCIGYLRRSPRGSLPQARHRQGPIARWIDEAPDQSALERAHDLAVSEMTAKIASGETRGVRDLAVVAGIMRDKMARYGEAPAPSGLTAVEVRDALHDWLVDDLVDESALTDDDALEAHHDAITGLISELLRLANAEAHQPNRPAILDSALIRPGNSRAGSVDRKRTSRRWPAR